MQDKKTIIVISIIFVTVITAVYFYNFKPLSQSLISTADSPSSENQNKENILAVEDITELEPQVATMNGITISSGLVGRSAWRAS